MKSLVVKYMYTYDKSILYGTKRLCVAINAITVTLQVAFCRSDQTKVSPLSKQASVRNC